MSDPQARRPWSQVLPEIGANISTLFRENLLTYLIPWVNSETGKLDNQFLDFSGLDVKGVWDASTNTPTLASEDADDKGSVYSISVSGSVDLGFGIESFKAGNFLMKVTGGWSQIPSLLPNPSSFDFQSVALLIADVKLSYSSTFLKVEVAAGDIVTAGGFRYIVAASDATDEHVETSGGVKLYTDASNGSNVKAFGAAGDGVTDDTAVLQKCFDSVSGRIFVPFGNYKVTAQLQLKQFNYIDAEQGAVFDWSGNADAVGIPHCMEYDEGSLSALPGISADVENGARDLVFDSDPGLVEGDLIIAYNPTDYSYSLHRDSYREGQFLKVASVDGSTVRFRNAIDIDIPASDFEFHKVLLPFKGGVRNLEIKGIPDTVNANNALTVKLGDGAVFRDVKISGSSNKGFNFYKCYDCVVDNGNVAEDYSPDFGNDYGIAWLNSERCVTSGGSYAAARHSVVTGTGGATGDVPCRHLKFLGLNATSPGSTLSSFNFHGNTDSSIVSNCNIEGRFDLSGNNNILSNNVIRSKGYDTKATIAFTELKGLSHIIEGNEITNRWVGTTQSSLCLDSSSGLNDEMSNGGTLLIKGNKFSATYDGPSSKDTEDMIRMYNDGYAGSERMEVVFDGNTFQRNVNGRWAINAGIGLAGSRPWDLISITGCNTFQTGLIQVSDEVGGEYAARDVYISNGIFKTHSADSQGIAVNNVSDNICVTGNTFDDWARNLQLQGLDASNPTANVQVSGNRFINTPWGLSGSATLDSLLRARYMTNLVVSGNYNFNDTKRLTVADGTQITEGGTITGQTSGATATVYKINGNDLAIKQSESATQFESGGETITDDTTSNTTTIAAGTVFNQKWAWRADSDILNCWRDHNIFVVDSKGARTALSTSVPGITNDETAI